jgi:catechol 2,3-dioxygenase-like lactoylglutathione lyase family enzyme
MPQPTAVLFYVVDPAKSTVFYEDLLGLKPAMTSPFYTLFKLANGFELALWALNKVEPPAPIQGASSELGFLVPDKAALELTHQQWVKKGIQIVLEPQKMYFGGTHFVGLDPDGHRLRVATPD